MGGSTSTYLTGDPPSDVKSKAYAEWRVREDNANHAKMNRETMEALLHIARQDSKYMEDQKQDHKRGRRSARADSTSLLPDSLQLPRSSDRYNKYNNMLSILSYFIPKTALVPFHLITVNRPSTAAPLTTSTTTTTRSTPSTTEYPAVHVESDY